MVIFLWIVDIIIFFVSVGVGGFPGFIVWAVLTGLFMFAQYANAQTKLKAADLLLKDQRLQDERNRQHLQAQGLYAPPAQTAWQPPPRQPAHGSRPPPPQLAAPSWQPPPPPQPPPWQPAPLPQLGEQDEPPHLWIQRRGNWQNDPLDFRTMMWGELVMVRRVSATQWEMKYEAEARMRRIAELSAQLARPPVAGPQYRSCSECGTTGVVDLHRPSCSKYSPAAEVAARARWEDEVERERIGRELAETQKEPAWRPFPERDVASVETRYQRYLLSGVRR
jgi:hypothetical protein